MAKAICIVSVNTENSSEFDEKSLKEILLENDDLKNRQIVPISVAGAMRTGKSFILNYFLRYLRAQYVSHDISNWLGDRNEPLKGFEWRAQVGRVTCGIMMWSEVFLHDHPEHGKLAIVLMDTQGLFDNQTTVKDNSVIFALSTMMVSVQIYNVMNNLNENDLQLMQLFAEYGKATMKSEASKPFQKLMILVRDWNPNNGLEFGSKGGRELIESRMKGDSRLKCVRDDINTSFDSLDGYLMSHPGPALYKKDFDGRSENLDPTFVETLKTFVESVLKPENLVPKRMNGELVTVSEYCNNFKFYAEYFSKSELPAPENFLAATANNNALNAMNAAVEMYRDIMRNLDQNIESLISLFSVHESVEANVLISFDEKTKFGRKYAESYRDQLNVLLQSLFEEIWKKTEEVIEYRNFPITPEEFKTEVMNPLEYTFKAVSTTIEGLFSSVARLTRSAFDGVVDLANEMVVVVKNAAPGVAIAVKDAAAVLTDAVVKRLKTEIENLISSQFKALMN